MSFRIAARYRVAISLHGSWFSLNTVAAALLANDGIAANIPSKIFAPRLPLAQHWLAINCTYFSCASRAVLGRLIGMRAEMGRMRTLDRRSWLPLKGREVEGVSTIDRISRLTLDNDIDDKKKYKLGICFGGVLTIGRVCRSLC